MTLHMYIRYLVRASEAFNDLLGVSVHVLPCIYRRKYARMLSSTKCVTELSTSPVSATALVVLDGRFWRHVAPQLGLVIASCHCGA